MSADATPSEGRRPGGARRPGDGPRRPGEAARRGAEPRRNAGDQRRAAGDQRRGADARRAATDPRERRAPEPRWRRESRRTRRPPGLDTPLESRRAVLPTPQVDPEAFGRWSERFARFMGTAQFIAGMTVFVALWLVWNTFAPGPLQFDPRSLNYTLLTLILSLQASYAAPLILLAQNRQADRDRVQAEQDRQRAERNLADTEYLAREVAALRIALRDVATRDFLRSELRDLLDELTEGREAPDPTKSGKKKKAKGRPVDGTSGPGDLGPSAADASPPDD